MSELPPRRRFIAGAVCPRCAGQDKIVVDLDTDRRVCVSCGFSEQRPGPRAAAPSEPHTRVNRALARRADTPAEPVTLVENARAGNERGQSPFSEKQKKGSDPF